MRAITVAVWLLACSPPPAGPPPSDPLSSSPAFSTGPAPATVVLHARMGKLTGDGQVTNIVPLSPGRRLAHGDGVEFNIELDHDAYVYVMYVNAQSQIKDLFPDRGHALMHRGHQRLPPYGMWWRMDDKQGPERFLVVAAAAPLDAPARRALAAKPRSRAVPRRASGARQKPVPDPPPCSDPDDPMACQGTRGDLVEIVAEPSSEGITVVDFAVEHR